MFIVGKHSFSPFIIFIFDNILLLTIVNMLLLNDEVNMKNEELWRDFY